MPSKVGKLLQRIQGIVWGDSVHDSALYFDGHEAVIDVLGQDAGSPAFTVRALNPQTNAATVILQVFKGGLAKVLSAPMARVYHDANQSIADSTWTTLAFNQERFDTDTIHDTATNNSRLTIQTAGKYILFANVEFDVNGTGGRGLRIILNGDTTNGIIGQVLLPATAAASQRMVIATPPYDFSAGDYVELQVWQNSGGARTVAAIAAYSPEFGIVRVG